MEVGARDMEHAVGGVEADVRAVDVVDVAVGVVVDAVRLLAAARLARVRPRLTRQIRMAEVDAVVDDRDGHAGAGDGAPGGRRIDVDVGHLVVALERRPAGVLEPPLQVVVGLLGWIAVEVELVVDLHRGDARIRPQRGHRIAQGRPDRLDHVRVDEIERPNELRARSETDAATHRLGRSGAVRDDEAVGVARRRGGHIGAQGAPRRRWSRHRQRGREQDGEGAERLASAMVRDGDGHGPLVRRDVWREGRRLRPARHPGRSGGIPDLVVTSDAQFASASTTLGQDRRAKLVEAGPHALGRIADRGSCVFS